MSEDTLKGGAGDTGISTCAGETIAKEPPSQPPSQPKGPGGTAIAALVLGIISFVFCGGCLTGIPAIITGAVELNAIKKGRASMEGRPLALVGLILGIVATAITLILLALAFASVIVIPIIGNNLQKTTL